MLSDWLKAPRRFRLKLIGGANATLPPHPVVRPVPALGRVKKAPASETEAAFAAGAGLAAVDAIVRAEPAFEHRCGND